MMKIAAAILLALCSNAWAGLIFDNGSGDKNDTLVIQFCLLDSTGERYTTWDTAYVAQAYGGVDFNIDTLLAPASYRLNSAYPRNLMFEYRLRAGDGNPAHRGAYTWWALLIDSNNGSDTQQMHQGSYYVNDDPLEDFLATGDNIGAGIVPDSLIARVDSIRWAVGMPMNIAGEKYSDNLHRKLGPYTGGNDNIKSAVEALSLTGGGSESCTLVVRQDGVVPIQAARIVVRTLDQTATRVPGLFTDLNGVGIAELDEGSYFISVGANNYVPLTDTLNVFRDSTWQFSMTLFDPGNPQSPDLCRVYGWIYDIGGESPNQVSISAEIPSEYQPLKYGDVIITPYRKTATSDSTGYWQIDLLPNNVLSRSDSKYVFVIEYPSGVIMKSKVAVPDSISWQFR